MNKSFKAENQIMQIALGKPPTTTQIKKLKKIKKLSGYITQVDT
jgi:hypothetical protein